MSRLLSQDEAGKIKVSKEAMALPEVKIAREKDHTQGKTYFAEIIKYVYFAYDKESPYNNLTVNQRKNVVWQDQFSDYSREQYEALMNRDETKNLIRKLNLLQYSPAERHLKACEDKFEQFEALYIETAVNHENYERIASQLRGSNSLYDVLEKLKEKVHKEVKEQNEGGYVPTMFEDE